ncbi:MAG: S8 family peptidase [Eubacteriales bacterium]|nr:S8 family peptidase [Eubacteriales bacterium]
MNKRYYRKIDPLILNGVRINSADRCRVFLYTKDRIKCLDCLNEMGITVLGELPFINGYYAEVPAGMVVKLAQSDMVDYVAADTEVKTQMYIAKKIVGVENYHEKGITGKGVGIAILDTGIYQHVDFTRPQNRIRQFVDLVNNRSQVYDDNGHGTFVAGVAAGNGYGSKGRFTGVAPEADIYALKTMDHNGNGNSATILKGMQWVADHAKEYNIRVVSLSLGSPAGAAMREDAMVRGAEQLWRQGVVVITAAGNEGPARSTITTPGTSGTVITVGALDDMRTETYADDKVADFSSRGPAERAVKPDIVAPGVDIISAAVPNLSFQRENRRLGTAEYTTMSGTSVSTPLVAGMAALLLQQNPDWTPDKVKRYLMQNARRIRGEFLSEGRGMALLKDTDKTK